MKRYLIVLAMFVFGACGAPDVEANRDELTYRWCGAAGQPCCLGTCSDGNVCGGDGKCVPCGGLLQVCCGNGACNSPLYCTNDLTGEWGGDRCY